MSAFWAGLTCFVWYAFGALPLHVAVSVQLGLTAAETSSWVFIVWFTGAVTSIFLSIKYRQPIPITWTIPGMIYIGTLAGQYSFAEILGANLVAGIAITFLGIYGFGQRIMTWMPLPIIMGMFAGSILIYVTRMVEATVTDASVAGLTVAAYLVGRGLKNPKLPPMGLAVVIGGIAAWLYTGLGVLGGARLQGTGDSGHCGCWH
jgi:benzoate membrane transport protein